MSQVLLRQITKTFNGNPVIEDLNVTIPSGSFTVLVGPSGCGKSTTLRMIAGLEHPTSGDIYIGEEKVNQVEPGKRDIAMVFQNYALYPTMTVKENIEFGLKNRKVPKPERERLIAEVAEVVGLREYLNRKPGELSGGQRQRVALARAMVKKPKVFLMDEPLSNLDAQLRQQMRVELMELHKKLGATFIYVTHDQVEAMSMGDQIIIMNHGKVQQAASPMEVYHQPANRFVATFIGTPPMNIVSVRWLDGKLVIGDQTVKLPADFIKTELSSVHAIGIRPEKIQLQQKGEPVPKERVFTCEGTIVAHEMLGAETLYYVDTQLGRLSVKSYGDNVFLSNQIRVELPYDSLYFFDAEGSCIPVRKETNAGKEERAVL
ncbi:ABC transporter ATP-binding protein [Collibacillus ludicampi]|uniref:ABC transporter ATP-binding protein n=1 Tax=Collibacillus ludicampi TaxID=2771369 RepID=A0AAV4LJU5_9BACL|nr:ATP-binding cassette domain-containing protein [Collibacillus ludicampi]GIM48098.1 ABC transporter ATP-binding protein [Collibacillus ludicampi]